MFIKGEDKIKFLLILLLFNIFVEVLVNEIK